MPKERRDDPHVEKITALVRKGKPRPSYDMLPGCCAVHVIHGFMAPDISPAEITKLEDACYKDEAGTFLIILADWQRREYEPLVLKCGYLRVGEIPGAHGDYDNYVYAKVFRTGTKKHPVCALFGSQDYQGILLESD